jgi:GNAT superfamily N-acetyltransferase
VTVRKLAAADKTDEFDCGKEALNRYLQRFALMNQRANVSLTYVSCRGDQAIAGYYSLTVGSVERESAPARISQGIGRYPVPVMLLARLAIDRREQGRGLGRALLKDALLRTMQAADIAGIRALLVHAKDAAARQWYERFDFTPSPSDPLHLYLLMKDIAALLR